MLIFKPSKWIRPVVLSCLAAWLSGFVHADGLGRADDAAAREQALATSAALTSREPVTSARVRIVVAALRAALQTGDFDRAARLLGRRYAMRGRVVAGQQLGRTLGFPTANIRLRRRRIPLGGIFAVRVRGIDGTVRAGVASLGTRPTVGGVEPLLETFVFDFEGDLYGRELEVEFVARLRGEERFESLDELVVQMHADERAARVALGMI